MDGEVRHLRFVVLANTRTYRFALRLQSSDEHLTVFRMTATDTLVRLAVPTMLIAFDTDSQRAVWYEGLVPPTKGESSALRKLDARVEYDYER